MRVTTHSRAKRERAKRTATTPHGWRALLGMRVIVVLRPVDAGTTWPKHSAFGVGRMTTMFTAMVMYNRPSESPRKSNKGEGAWEFVIFWGRGPARHNILCFGGRCPPYHLWLLR